MRLKLTLVRPSGSSSDLVVTADAAATISEVAATISRVDAGATHKPERNLTLRATLPGQSDPLTLPPDVPVGEAWIGSGASVSLHDAGVMYRAPSELKEATVGALRVLAGPDAGREFPLKTGSLIVGRDSACDIVLSDNLVSKKHVRLEVSDTVEVIDLGSANGVVVDGGIVARLHIEKYGRLLLGDDDIEISLTAGAAPDAAPKPGPIFFNRSPKVETRYNGTEFTAPAARDDDPGLPRAGHGVHHAAPRRAVVLPHVAGDADR
jgi:S-DNA-T family DNA segregation ATPase FtsK/SpoIIIE